MKVISLKFEHPSNIWDISFTLSVEKLSISILFKLEHFWNILTVLVILYIFMFLNLISLRLVHSSNIEVVSKTISVSIFSNETFFILLHPENISLKVVIVFLNLIIILTALVDLTDKYLSKETFFPFNKIITLSEFNSLKLTPNIWIFSSISWRIRPSSELSFVSASIIIVPIFFIPKRFLISSSSVCKCNISGVLLIISIIFLQFFILNEDISRYAISEQLENILFISITFSVINLDKSKLSNEEQLSNILFIYSTFSVLKEIILSSSKLFIPLNIPDISLTLLVSYPDKSKDFILEQPENILFIFSVLLVDNPSMKVISLKLEHPSNIWDISFTLSVEKFSISILFKLEQSLNILDVFVISKILVPSNKILLKLVHSSNIDEVSMIRLVLIFLNMTFFILLHPLNIPFKVFKFFKNLISTLEDVSGLIDTDLSKIALIPFI